MYPTKIKYAEKEPLPFSYKVNVLEALKAKGYSSYRIRKEKLFSENTLSSFRAEELPTWKNLGKLCELLECDIGDIIQYEKREEMTEDASNPQ